MPAPDSSLQHFILPNGLRVYLREDHRAPLVSTQLWYHVGASHEPDGLTGLSHLLEHLLFEGSSKLAPGQYSALMTRLGGDPNAFTLEEATVFPLTLPASRLEIALEAMADSMASATLDATPFARELKVVMAERRGQVDNNPLALALEGHRSLAFGTSRYAPPVIGHVADLRGMHLEAVRHWYRTWYHPNNATLAVVGAVGLQHLRVWVERHFAAIPRADLPKSPVPRQPPGLQGRSQTLCLPGLREGVLMSFNTPSLATATSSIEADALSLLPDLLGNGAGSHLYRHLLRGEQVLQALRADYEPLLRGDSLFSLYAFTNPVNATPQAAAERLLDAIASLRDTAPAAHELQRAKARLLARQVFQRDDIANQAQAIGKHAASGLDPALLDQQAQAIEAISAEQVRQAAHDYLTEDRLTLTLMLGKDSTDE